jgi:L-glyceraldehyde 3-phosphate reductase
MVQALNQIAQARGQSLAQMSLAWALRDRRITSVLVGASSVSQLDENVAALNHLVFEAEVLQAIEQIVQDGGINLWAQSSSF